MGTTKFRIVISSDIEYNDLCAEIYFEDQFVAILTQEQGFENLEIQIYAPQNQNFWEFKFSEFEAILASAKQSLFDMRRTE